MKISSKDKNQEKSTILNAIWSKLNNFGKILAEFAENLGSGTSYEESEESKKTNEVKIVKATSSIENKHLRSPIKTLDVSQENAPKAFKNKQEALITDIPSGVYPTLYSQKINSKKKKTNVKVRIVKPIKQIKPYLHEPIKPYLDLAPIESDLKIPLAQAFVPIVKDASTQTISTTTSPIAMIPNSSIIETTLTPLPDTALPKASPFVDAKTTQSVQESSSLKLAVVTVNPAKIPMPPPLPGISLIPEATSPLGHDITQVINIPPSFKPDGEEKASILSPEQQQLQLDINQKEQALIKIGLPAEAVKQKLNLYKLEQEKERGITLPTTAVSSSAPILPKPIFAFSDKEFTKPINEIRGEINKLKPEDIINKQLINAAAEKGNFEAVFLMVDKLTKYVGNIESRDDALEKGIIALIKAVEAIDEKNEKATQNAVKNKTDIDLKYELIRKLPLGSQNLQEIIDRFEPDEDLTPALMEKAFHEKAIEILCHNTAIEAGFKNEQDEKNKAVIEHISQLENAKKTKKLFEDSINKMSINFDLPSIKEACSQLKTGPIKTFVSQIIKIAKNKKTPTIKAASSMITSLLTKPTLLVSTPEVLSTKTEEAIKLYHQAAQTAIKDPKLVEKKNIALNKAMNLVYKDLVPSVIKLQQLSNELGNPSLNKHIEASFNHHLDRVFKFEGSTPTTQDGVMMRRYQQTFQEQIKHPTNLNTYQEKIPTDLAKKYEKMNIFLTTLGIKEEAVPVAVKMRETLEEQSKNTNVNANIPDARNRANNILER